MKVNLDKISTEQRNESTKDIDLLKTKEILVKINDEDKKVAYCVEEALDDISMLVDKTTEVLYNDGRIIYMGAGTSGRIGILDAVECPPTYGVSYEDVMCLMAGGSKAFIKAVEGAEDSKELGVNDLKNVNLSSKDIVIGIAASGRTPYVIGGIEYAKSVGALTACIVTSKNSPLAGLVDYKIEAITNEEVITGSTRMKSGTAQKMICNMISTATMIKLGKVYQNYMIDVMATNEKLVARSISMLSQICGVGMDEAKEKIAKYKTVKKALFAHLTKIDEIEKIDYYLNMTKGHIRNAISLARSKEND